MRSKIEIAFIEQTRRIDLDATKIKSSLSERGVPIEIFTEKRLLRRQLPLSRNCLVVGTVPTVDQALKQLKIEYPPFESYPPCLTAYMHRKTWKTTFRKIIGDVLADRVKPTFVKPATRTKRFTGFVLTSYDSLWQSNGASKSIDVQCSEIVEWLTEYRVFVHNGKIAGICNYSGDKNVLIDLEIVNAAIRDFEKSGTATKAYGADFGVLSSGETALVEINDATSLGSYELPADIYTDLIVDRWNEIMGY